MLGSVVRQGTRLAYRKDDDCKREELGDHYLCVQVDLCGRRPAKHDPADLRIDRKLGNNGPNLRAMWSAFRLCHDFEGRISAISSFKFLISCSIDVVHVRCDGVFLNLGERFPLTEQWQGIMVRLFANRT